MNTLLTKFSLPQVTSDEGKATTERKPANSYFLLDSADRNQNAGLIGGYTDQNPWNNFRLQRPQPLMGAFARRITVSEIKFPWFIPNITEYNNKLYLEVGGVNFPPITIPVGFYTPAQLVAAINSALAVAFVPFATPPPTISYNTTSMRYTFLMPIAGIGSGIGTLYWYDPNGIGSLTFGNFVNSASLFKTLGFTYAQSGSPIPPTDSITGLGTLSQYTSFVDICSDKLMTYADIIDGNSYQAGKDRVMCRVFATDETSSPIIATTDPITSHPFVIHRQFKNPKEVQWNPESTIDWLDIQVFDEYGNLVPLPTTPILNSFPNDVIVGAYPDFQITCQASEN